MKLVRSLSHFPSDFGPILPGHLPALDAHHDLSARQIIENVEQGETTHRLTWEIKGAIQENTDVAIARVDEKVIQLQKLSELDRF